MTSTFRALALIFAGVCGLPHVAQAQTPSRPSQAELDAWLTPFPKAPADTFVRQGVRSGSLVTRAECEAANGKDRARFVYVEALGRGACIRYHLSAETFPGKVAAVYLPGDKGGFRISWRNGQYEMLPEELIPRDGQPAGETKAPDMGRKLGEPDRNQSFSRALGGRLQTPTILLARQGTDGSSGWVALRRTRWEVEVTNRALDAIKARHGIEKLHLVGQSGGGHLVGSLSALRTDIACAVAGSAPLAFDPKSFYLSDKVPAPQRFFNPVDHAETIAKKPGLRLMLVTDGGDTRVFVDRQAAFVRALARHGVKTPQFFVTAGDALSHGVTTYSVAALRLCIEGKSADEIAVELAKMNAQALERRLKAVQERQSREDKSNPASQPKPPARPAEPTEPSPEQI
jgi:pimeloyl-ACP methyl ester carboxylesterase